MTPWVQVVHRISNRIVVDVGGMGDNQGEGWHQAGRGAQLPVPWDLFGLPGKPIEHRRHSKTHHGHRSVFRISGDDMNDDEDGDGICR